MYQFILDDVVLLLSPEKLTVNVGNKNKTLDLVSIGEINVLKSIGLREYEFEVLLPGTAYPFLGAGDFKEPQFFMNKLRQMKKDRKPFIHTGDLYMLYDDAGALTLKKADDMKLDLVISASNTLMDYKYTTDIYTETYNKVTLYRDNQTTGVREVFVAQDSGNMGKWGILQLQEKMDENLTDAQMIDLVERKLALYNKVQRTLSVEEFAGAPNIRAGNTLLVEIADIGDISIRQWLMIEKCVHTIKNNQHTMALDFTGDIT